MNKIIKMIGVERIIRAYKGLMISSKIAAIIAIFGGFKIIGVYAMVGIFATLAFEVLGEYKIWKMRRQAAEFEKEFGENSQYYNQDQDFRPANYFTPQEQEIEDIGNKIIAGQEITPREVQIITEKVKEIIRERAYGREESISNSYIREQNFVKEAISFACSYAGGKHDLRFSDEQRGNAFLYVVSVVDMQAMPSVEKMNAILNAIKAHFKDVFIIEIPDFIFEY